MSPRRTEPVPRSRLGPGVRSRARPRQRTYCRSRCHLEGVAPSRFRLGLLLLLHAWVFLSLERVRSRSVGPAFGQGARDGRSPTHAPARAQRDRWVSSRCLLTRPAGGCARRASAVARGAIGECEWGQVRLAPAPRELACPLVAPARFGRECGYLYRRELALYRPLRHRVLRLGGGHLRERRLLPSAVSIGRAGKGSVTLR
jgi:hypothetical protein